MKTSPIISFLLVTLLATACGTSDATDEDHAPGAAEMGNEHHAGAVLLNSGQPWAANTETTQGVNAMLALVKSYDTANGDGAVLKEELTAEFKEIFAKCTMTGEAHEQLHNYLIPIHKMLDKLSAEPSEEEIAELRGYLGTYGKYFR